MEELSEQAIANWLTGPQDVPHCNFPDAAAVLARWIANGCHEPVDKLGAELWQNRSLQEEGRLILSSAAAQA